MGIYFFDTLISFRKLKEEFYSKRGDFIDVPICPKLTL